MTDIPACDWVGGEWDVELTGIGVAFVAVIDSYTAPATRTIERDRIQNGPHGFDGDDFGKSGE